MHPQLANGPASTDRNGDEAELVERAKARSADAWSTIYDRHYDAIFRYALARVFERETAADLASAVFLAALDGISSYRYTGRPLLAWLYRIARNVVVDHQRKTLGRRGVPVLGAGLGIFERWSGRADDSRDIAATSDPSHPDAVAQRLDLQRAVAKLPDSQREVLILRFFLGLSTDEIAAVTGKERAAVYSLHARAITTLRRSLAQ